MQIDTAQVRAVASDLEGGLVDMSADAREAVTRSVGDGRELVIARSADLRDALGDRAGVWGGLAKGRAADLSGELEERAGAARDVLRARARELEQDLPVDTDDALAYAQMGAWQLVRGLIVVVAFIPGLIVRALGGLADVVDELSHRGVDVRGRGRDLAAAVPGAGRRRSSRRRNLLLLALGATVGVVAGIAASRRRAPVVTYDVPPHVAGDGGGAHEVADLSDAAELSDVATPNDAPVPSDAADDR